MRTDPRIEAAARVLYEKEPWTKGPWANDDYRWEELDDCDRDEYIEMARADLAAAEATGNA